MTYIRQQLPCLLDISNRHDLDHTLGMALTRRVVIVNFLTGLRSDDKLGSDDKLAERMNNMVLLRSDGILVDKRLVDPSDAAAAGLQKLEQVRG